MPDSSDANLAVRESATARQLFYRSGRGSLHRKSVPMYRETSACLKLGWCCDTCTHYILVVRRAGLHRSYQLVSMIKIYADFNDKTTDGGYWILQHEGADLADQVDELGLAAGDRVLLFQDPDDFEVEAVLDFKFVDIIGRKAWVATPNWVTMKRKSLGD